MIESAVVIIYSLSVVAGQTPGIMVLDPNCTDRIDSCASFPDSSCKDPYVEWAKQNCRQRCKFCVGPSTAAPPCVDMIKNCADYSQAVCSKTEYNTWVNKNCRAFCKRCTAEQIQRLTTTTTTISPKDCYDKVDCRTYGTNACDKSFEDWSKDNCPLTCGYCIGTPTTPPVCVDRIPNCKAYNANTCSDPDFQIWVEDNCRKFCGLC